MQEHVIRYTLDDRETNIILTTARGSERVIFSVEPPYRSGTTPGMKLHLLLSHDGLEALRQYFTVAVRRAMVRDDIAHRKQVEVPIFIDAAQLTLCLSPNDVDNLERHMREASAHARSLVLN